MSFLLGNRGFSPDDIVSLAHWYDATKLSGFSDGNSVGTWPDEEGTDDLTQGTGSKQPTYQTNVIGGQPVVRFDGSDDLLAVDWTDISLPYQFFLVAELRVADSGSFETVLDGFTSPSHNFSSSDTNVWRINQGAVQTGSGDDENPHIFTGTWRSSPSNDELRVDATQDILADAGDSSSDGLTLGANGGDGGNGPWDIGEVVFYDEELSTSDRDRVESYLADKWGITI